jgi:hypothetical protein
MTFEYKGKRKAHATRIISYIDDIYEVGQTFRAGDAVYHMTYQTSKMRKNIPQQQLLSRWLKINPRFRAVGINTGLWRRVE